MRFRFVLLSALCIAGALPSLSAPKAPQGLRWNTVENPVSLGSPAAQPGGKLRLYLQAYPLTLRQVGPDSNQAFRRYMDENDLSLLNLHPNTQQWLPELATHWAIDPSRKTVYYRLDPNARWSDGKPVKASDYQYILTFMRSPHIKAPWYQEYYTKTIRSIDILEAFGQQEQIAIHLHEASPDPLYTTNLRPLPEHFYGTLDENFVKKFQWKIPPNTGPYQITALNKGRSVVFRKTPQWWARDKSFFRHRFSIEEVELIYLRDPQVAMSYLTAGSIDALAVNSPEQWQAIESSSAYKNGYIHRLQFFNEIPRSDYALILNSAFSLFREQKMREAFSYAMNVDKVIEELLKNDYRRLQGISRGYGPYTNEKIRARPYSPADVNRLLEETGWTERDSDGIRTKAGQRLTASISYASSTLSPRLILLSNEARKLGIELTLNLKEAGALFKSFLDKEHQIALISWGTPYRPEYRSRFHSSLALKAPNSNLSNTASPQLDQLIEEYEHAESEDVRIQKARAIQQFVHDDASYIPLFEVPYYRLAYAAWLKFPAVPSAKSADDLSLFDHGTGGLAWIDRGAKSTLEDARKLPPQK